MKNNDLFITPKNIVKQIEDNTTLCTVGMTLTGASESILSEIENSFLQNGYPRNLTLLHAAGQSDRKGGIQHLAHQGLIKRVIGGHWGLSPGWMEFITNDKVEAFCLPQGQITHLYSAMASGQDGRLSNVGIGTFIDPRFEGGKMNALTRKCPDLLEVVEFKGKEFLYYPSIPPQVVIVRGTTADEDGNITCEEEPMKLEILPAVMATKRYGGKVYVQVKYRVQAGSLNARDVVIPGCMVDGIVVVKDFMQDHRQSSTIYFDPSLTGMKKMSVSEIYPAKHDIRRIIGRIASQYLFEKAIINLGTGIPNDVIGCIIQEEAASAKLTITVESGIYGGTPKGGVDFGISQNLDAMISHNDQMTFYNGKGVDITFMGAGELDKNGNVNATKMGNICPGAGGFIDITQNARHIVFCSTFTTKGLEIEFQNNELKILNEGSIKKLVKNVKQISFSGDVASKKQQIVHFVTERAVFEIVHNEVHLVQVAPGIDIERDILSLMEFRPIISTNIKIINPNIFKNVPLNLLTEKKNAYTK